MSRGKTLRKTTITAGPLVMEVLCSPPLPRDNPRQRAEKQFATSEARKQLNQKTARRKFRLLLAANFGRNSHVLTLTCSDRHLPASRAEARELLRKYLRRLRAALRRDGRELRYLYVIEHKHGEGRWHFHMVLNTNRRDREAVLSLWDYGEITHYKRLERKPDGSIDYKALADYMTKESVEGKPLGARMWTGSRNLRKPTRKTERVTHGERLFVPPRCIPTGSSVSMEVGAAVYQFIEYYDPQMEVREANGKQSSKVQDTT